MVYYPVYFEVICCYFNIPYKTLTGLVQIIFRYLHTSFLKRFVIWHYVYLFYVYIITLKFSTITDEFRTLIFKYVLMCLLVDHLIFDLFCIQ